VESLIHFLGVLTLAGLVIVSVAKSGIRRFIYPPLVVGFPIPALLVGFVRGIWPWNYSFERFIGVLVFSFIIGLTIIILIDKRARKLGQADANREEVGSASSIDPHLKRSALRIYCRYAEPDLLGHYWGSIGIPNAHCQELALEMSEIFSSNRSVAEYIRIALVDREAAIKLLLARYDWMERDDACFVLDVMAENDE
jgi:hypothetical protein